MKRNIYVLIAFILVSFSLFWPIFFGKVNLNGNSLVSFYPLYGQNLAYKNTATDQLRIYYPFISIQLDQLKKGNLPLWNPYLFSGNAQMANIQGAVFYPLTIFGVILPQIEFWHLLRISPMILTAFFMFLYLVNLPKGWNISRLAGFFGALTFGFSPFILTWGEEQVIVPHSVLWLPLIFYCIEKILAGKSRVFLALISLSVAFSIFAGFPQTTVYVLVLSVCYLIFRTWELPRHGINKIAWILGFFGLGIAVAGVQLVPALELYFLSARQDILLTEINAKFLLPVSSLLTFLSPDFFGNPASWNFFRNGAAHYYEGILFIGIPAIVFALYTWQGKIWKPVYFFSIAAIVALSLTLDLPTSRLFLSLPIPIIGTAIPNRVLIICAFCLSFLAAFGMQIWLEGKRKGIYKVLIFIFGILAAATAYAFAASVWGLPYFGAPKWWIGLHVMISIRNNVIPIFVFSVLTILIIGADRFKHERSRFAILIIGISFLHIFYFSQKYFSFAERSVVFPETPAIAYVLKNQGVWRAWAIGDATFENNLAGYYKLNWPEGYASLNEESYARLLFWVQHGTFDKFNLRADAVIGGGKTEETLGNPYKRRLIDLLGIKYVFAKDEEVKILELNGFKKLEGFGKFSVFENLNVMPRAFLASSYEGPPDVAGGGETEQARLAKEKVRRELIPQKLFNADFDFRNSLILEKGSSVSPQFGPGRVEIISHLPSKIRIKTQALEPKILFISDNYYPGWEARVDGDPTEILRADYTFMAVPLTPGEHIVEFSYEPWSFKAGAIVSLAGLMVIALLINPKLEIRSTKQNSKYKKIKGKNG